MLKGSCFFMCTHECTYMCISVPVWGKWIRLASYSCLDKVRKKLPLEHVCSCFSLASVPTKFTSETESGVTCLWMENCEGKQGELLLPEVSGFWSRQTPAYHAVLLLSFSWAQYWELRHLMQGMHSHPGEDHLKPGITMLNCKETKFCNGAGSKGSCAYFN